MDVLLCYSGEPSKLPRLPLSLLALAAYIRKYGYNPTILDTRITRWITNDYTYPFEKFDIICIGSMTGHDLNPGMHISQYIKKYNPKIPIIWGGQHVSATKIKERYMDAIIVGEGEKALLTALKDLEKGQLKERYEQEIEDMDNLPFPAYDLVDIKNYLDGKEDIGYEPSRGCTSECSFCYVNYFHHRKWRSKSPDKIINEIELIKEKYNPKKIKLVGDNFFANKKQALEVCKRLKGIQWSSTIRIDYLANFTDEEMQVLKDSGCWLLALGAESGSLKTLKKIKKGITPEQTLIAAEKCSRYGILPVFSMMIGIPGEEWEDILQTLNLYDKIEKIKGTETNGLFIYFPYYGTELYDEAIKLGFEPPKNIHEWADEKLLTRKLPWHGKMGPSLETISKISRFKYFIKHMKYFSKESIRKKLGALGITWWVAQLGLIPFKVSASIRWKSRFFKLGYEWNIFFWMLSFFSEVY